jgi:hypothetical protein
MMSKFIKQPIESAPQPGGSDMFKEFNATELYCPNCRQAGPVRERLLLVLPDGDKYEYLCARCLTSVGTKIDRNTQPVTLIR